MKTTIADQEKNGCLAPWEERVAGRALRRAIPVIAGRMMVAVAVTVEIGKENARILNKATLDGDQFTKRLSIVFCLPCRNKKSNQDLRPSQTKPTLDLRNILTTGTRKETSCVVCFIALIF